MEPEHGTGLWDRIMGRGLWNVGDMGYGTTWNVVCTLWVARRTL